MHFFRRLIQVCLFMSLGVVILAAAITQLIASGTSIDTMVSQSGLYETLATEARSNLVDSPKLPPAYQEAFKSALNQTLTAEAMQAMVQPAIVDIATWLNQPENIPPPDVVIVVKPTKDALIARLATSQIPPLELATLQSQLNTQIPDQVRLSSLQDLTGQTADQSSPANPDAFTNSLKQLKGYVNILHWFLPVALGIVVVWTAILLWVGRREGRGMWRHPAWAYLLAGSMWLLMAWLIPAFFKPSAGAVTTSGDITTRLVPSIIAQTLAAGVWTASGCVLVGALLYAVSFLGGTGLAQPATRITPSR